ncbi:hypothetical protein Q7P35_005587 [Cladosporium inversicolor]
MQAGLLGELRYTNSEYAVALDIGYSFGLWLGAQMWTLDHQAQQILAAISVAADRVNGSLSARRIEYRLTSQKQDPLGQQMIRNEVLETLRNRMSSNHRAFALIAMAFACYSILDGANVYPEQQRNLVFRLAKHQLEDINDRGKVLEVDELHQRLSQIGQHLPEKLEEFLLELQKPIVILLVTADPRDQVALQLDEEHSRMEQAIQSSNHRREFTIHRLPNARPENLNPALRRRRPTIIHFSGHGSSDGLCFVDAIGNATIVDPEVLGRILGEANRMYGLCAAVMNACFSELQGQHIANAVGNLVAFKGEVNDDSALNFSREFYAALGDGLVVEDAFTAAVSGAAMTWTDPGFFQPVLLKRDALMLQLLEMGFSRSLSEKALVASARTGIEDAVSWLEQNVESL